MGRIIRRPTVVIRSDGRPGPVVAFVGGVHGDEFYGPAAVLIIAKRLAATAVHGEVILVPAANPFAVEERARSSARVRGNLNRQFGSEARSADRTLYLLAQRLWEKHLARADVLIDIHSGGHQRMLPHARFTGAPSEILPITRAIGINYAMHYASLPSGLLISKARSEGARALGLEIGGALELDQRLLRKLSDGLWNLLIHLDVVRGVERKSTAPDLVRPGTKQRASVPGWFIPRVDVGANVRKGETLGTFTSLRALRDRQIRALRDGKVYTILTGGPTTPGETLIEIVSARKKLRP